MSTAVIIGNGTFPMKWLQTALDADYVVCCDGAFGNWLEISGRLPDAVIGDMDSIEPELMAKYPDIMVPVSEQENNDQTKAFQHILKHRRDASVIHILGATGKREDHTIGNLSLLMEYARRCGTDGTGTTPTVDILTETCRAFAITDSCNLNIGKGNRISIFSPDNSLRIKSEGLVWSTDGVTFDNWWQATLNRASEDIVSLSFSHKSIALIITS